MKEGHIGLLLVLPGLLILGFLVIYGLGYNVFLSTQWLKGREFVFVGTKNWIEVLTNEDFLPMLGRTGMFVAFTVSAEIFLGLAVMHLLNLEFSGVRALRLIVILPMVMTPEIVALLWRFLGDYNFSPFNILLRQSGLGPGFSMYDTPESAILFIGLVDIWQWAPFVALILFAGMTSLPKEPFEAAAIDGATGLQAFKNITLPLLAPFIGISLLFRIADAFAKTFESIFLITGGGPGSATTVITYKIYLEIFTFFNFGRGAALGIILSVINMSVAFFLLYRLRHTFMG